MSVGILGVSAPASGVETTLYTCPSGYKTVGTVLATNTTTGYVQINVGLTASTGSISQSGWFVYQFQLPPDGLPYTFAGVITGPSNKIVVKSVSGASGAVNYQYQALEDLV